MPEECKDKAADARFMKNRGKIMPSYNVQVASCDGFILAANVANNNAENDQHELPAILESVKKNTGKRIETTLISRPTHPLRPLPRSAVAKAVNPKKFG